MKRHSLPVVHRAAETDATVLMLVGLVVVLMLVIGGGGMMLMWQWQRASQAQLMTREVMMQAREAEAARMQADQAVQQERLAIRRHEQVRVDEAARISGLISASASSPWPAVTLVPVEREDSPPPGGSASRR